MRKTGFLIMLLLSSLACNFQRVLDPSSPTSPAETQVEATTTTTTLPATSTPTFEARVEAGDFALFSGDWDLALREYQGALNAAQEDGLRSAALLGIGRTQSASGELTAARETLTTLLNLFPDSNQSAAAHFVLADVEQALDNPAEAATHYSSYLELRPGLLDSYVQEWRGDALLASGDYPEAVLAYQNAVISPRLGSTEGLQQKIADAHFQQGDYQAALIAYQSLYLSTANDYVKAAMDLSMGRSYIALEQPEEAYPLYLDAVEHYPLAFSSYAALVELVNAEVPVNELDRGLVDYYAATSLEAGGDIGGAAELYGVAIAAFDRYLVANPDEHDSTAHHYRALALRALDDYDGAVQEWDGIIKDHAFDRYWDEAYAQKTLTQWAYLDNYDAGIDTLLGFVATTPGQSRAAEFLFTAGRIAERGGQLTRSAEIWSRISQEYTNSEFAFDGLFLAGISRYRLNEIDAAQSLFVAASEHAVSLEDQSRAIFWVGKAREAKGNADGARSSWEQAAAIDPTGYYSERARDLLANIEPFTGPDYSLDYDREGERAEAESWIIDTFELAGDTNLKSLGSLANDSRYQRGVELWSVGEYELARAEFESLRLAVQDDPADSYRLANILIDLGLYRSGIFAARQVLSLAGMSDADTMRAPIYFNRIRFGIYFQEYVLDQAEEDGLHPLFILSVMRQESLFEGFVTSSAGARGLMQIVPGTGQEIATLRGWPPNFTAQDLYRPIVSIFLGTDYLATQRNSFDNLYAALAGYNAGPGWASYWSSLDEDDIDLFVEVIHFSETRDYVRSIYELFSIYSDLYAVE